MRNYLDLLSHVLLEGAEKPDRTGTGTLSTFGERLKFDLREGFPLVTTKATHFRSIRTELLWMLRGETNIVSLQARNVKIWDEWADEAGDLGPVYGKQWRSWDGSGGRSHDQIGAVVDTLRVDPHSRRMVVSAWNVDDLADMALAPCHCLFQFYSDGDNLDCQMYQRSADIFLGVPFNIASYAMLTTMMAHVCGMQARYLTIAYGDLHLYTNHVEQAQVQLMRHPRSLPTLRLDPNVLEIDDFREDSIMLEGYEPHPRIPAPVAV